MQFLVVICTDLTTLTKNSRGRKNVQRIVTVTFWQSTSSINQNYRILSG